MFHAVHTSLAEVAEDAGATPLETRDATSVVDALITPSVTATANLRARGHSPFAPVYAGLLLKRAVRWPHRWGLRYFELTLRGFDRGGDHPSQESQSFVRYRDWDGSGPWRAMAVGSSELFLPRDARGACAVFGRAELQTNRDDGAEAERRSQSQATAVWPWRPCAALVSSEGSVRMRGLNAQSI